ncbi:hypothetical protein [Roseibium suaedae]|uniref:Uncharacterized protein n=1 Tax=Roseibium suaedae TaxID=735517 RepID=A0A1M7PTB6_9HYPH|nr:hypothetical protein [Roseibium suaedae]SHN20647.1 hypothetical protein SAMN05444272_4625 [Roseibium suaedae]
MTQPKASKPEGMTPYVFTRDVPGEGQRGEIKNLTADQAKACGQSIRPATVRDLAISGKR